VTHQPTIDMQELDRMRPPDEARAIVLGQVRLLEPESISLNDAAWRTLADDLVAPEDHPPFPASTMDGYAVVAADGSPWREVLGAQMAGNLVTAEVTEGTAVRIMTGAPLPRGADAVVRVEATEPTEDHVIIHQEDVSPGENIRPIGSDVRAGDVILPAGAILGPAEIGLVAAMGINPVTVRRRARVSVVSTGDELVEPGDPVGPGQIRDSNRFSLVAALHADGAEITYAGKAPDERVAFESLLRERVATDDIVVTSGGVSMGDLDLVKAVLFDADDMVVHFRRLYMKPGKPLNFATIGRTLIFGLPGNPVSSLVTFELFIRPALRKMAGMATIDRPRVPVTLAHEVAPTDRIEFQRAVVTVAPAGHLVAHSSGPQGSSRLQSFIGANALVVIPPREFPYPAGERVEAILLGPPLLS